MELKETIVEALPLTKLELHPGLHQIVTLDMKEPTHLSNHHALCLPQVEDKMLCIVEDELYLENK